MENMTFWLHRHPRFRPWRLIFLINHLGQRSRDKKVLKILNRTQDTWDLEDWCQGGIKDTESYTRHLGLRGMEPGRSYRYWIIHNTDKHRVKTDGETDRQKYKQAGKLWAFYKPVQKNTLGRPISYCIRWHIHDINTLLGHTKCGRCYVQ
jgi:hypothetical protein